MENEKEISLNENQLIQMAQQEEATLNSRQQLMNTLSDNLRETTGAIEALKEITGYKGKMMVKLGAGIYVEAEVATDKCKRSFAEDGYKEEKIEETLKALEKRKENIEKQANVVAKEIMVGQQRLSQIISILQQIEAEKRKNFSASGKQKSNIIAKN